MNKLKQLTKRLGIEAVMVLGVILVAVGIMVFTGSMATEAAERKSKAEAGLGQDNAQLSTMDSQTKRFNDAEQRFIEIQRNHENVEFSSNMSSLAEWFKTAMAKYRFVDSTSKLMTAPEPKPSDKPELSGLGYDIIEHNGMVFETKAMSDLHVFSFLEAMRKSAPGFMRIDYLLIDRSADLTPQVAGQMLGGLTPSLVTARIRFTWVGINPKVGETSPDPNAAQNGATP